MTRIHELAWRIILEGKSYSRAVCDEGGPESGPFSRRYVGKKMGMARVEMCESGSVYLTAVTRRDRYDESPFAGIYACLYAFSASDGYLNENERTWDKIRQYSFSASERLAFYHAMRAVQRELKAKEWRKVQFALFHCPYCKSRYAATEGHSCEQMAAAGVAEWLPLQRKFYL